ncbi:MAG: hypothetical protein OEW06_00695 [Gemmatimonadota bacterium]|nr:hypothetical protein [Gemmatimonadota bacterium]
MTLPEISISALVSSVTVDGEPANVAIERGAPPAENAAPVIDATLPAAAINGGSFEVAVTGAEQFSEVVIGMPNVPDYFRVTLTSPKTSAKIVVTLDPGTPGGPLQMFVAAGKSPTEYGPYVTRLLSVMRVGSGDVQVSVAWNSAADVDLHVVDPDGDEIYWEDRQSASGGELDLDSNAACSSDQPRNENTVWPVGQAPNGTYIVRLDHWDSCGAEQTDYVVTVWVKGRDPQTFSGSFTGDGEHGGAGDGIEITTFTR